MHRTGLTDILIFYNNYLFIILRKIRFCLTKFPAAALKVRISLSRDDSFDKVQQ